MNKSRIVALDLETTGLTPDLGYHDSGHEPWEFGLIVRDGIRPIDDVSVRKRDDAEYLWRVKPDLAKADPQALSKNRYYERTAQMEDPGEPGIYNLAEWPVEGPRYWSTPALLASRLARLIDKAVVLGANPGFDKDFLRPFLARHGQAYTAHYRPLCVTAMGYAYLCALGKAQGLSWPLSSDEVSRALGVDPGDYDRHSALGDCRWALAQFDVVTGGS